MAVVDVDMWWCCKWCVVLVKVAGHRHRCCGRVLTRRDGGGSCGGDSVVVMVVDMVVMVVVFHCRCHHQCI